MRPGERLGVAAMDSTADRSRKDDAARAGWLYFIAGNTQGQIAQKLNVSRPTAQRLVSLALSERLITFRLDHPIAACMELAARLTKRFDLLFCDVVPSDPASDSTVLGIAESTSAFLEQKLGEREPIIVAIGTGRTLRAAVEMVPRMICHQHKLVSLVGHISMSGSASFFDVLARLSELSQAPHFPMPLPVIVRFPEEREQLQRIEPVLRVLDLARNADFTLVGIGRMDEQAQLQADGFIAAEELEEMRRLGAVGEVTGWAFDAAGNIIRGGTNDRVTSVPRDVPPRRLVVGVAQGVGKILPIHAALRGRIINGLITNETTARSILDLG
jgi:DNA-binding transcriptional regulator LsrR (DeoR family)